MSRRVFRIASDAPGWNADDMSGVGAELSGGRWNAKGTAVLYASETIALACLETIVHLGAGTLPLNRYLVALDIPDAVWSAARHAPVAALPIGWDAEPPGRVSVAAGSAWLAGAATAVLRVPSIIVPEEYNLLINPAHRDAASIRATKLRKWTYDARLRS